MKENPGKKESEFKSSITGINDLPSEFQDIIQQLVETENKLYTKSVTDYFNSVAKEFQGYLENENQSNRSMQRNEMCCSNPVHQQIR